MKAKVKNGIIYFTTWLSFFAFLLAACGLGEGSIWPYIICGISGAWLALFFAANKEGVAA